MSTGKNTTIAAPANESERSRQARARAEPPQVAPTVQPDMARVTPVPQPVVPQAAVQPPPVVAPAAPNAPATAKAEPSAERTLTTSYEKSLSDLIKRHEKYPDKWIPAYSQVTFSPHIRYSDALKRGQRQESIMQEVMQLPGISEKWESELVENLILERLAR